MDLLLDILRYVCWVLWVLSLPLAVIFMFPVLMSTSAPLGGGPSGWILVAANLFWLVGVPILLYRWGQA